MNEKINSHLIEANIKLQDENKLLKEDKEILQRRINKAIEYIENENYKDDTICCINGVEILKILKGKYIYEQ